MWTQSLPDAGQVERALAAVYARPEFAAREPSVLARLWDAFWARLREPIFALLRWLDPDERVIGWIGIAVLVAAAAVALAWIARGAAATWRARERRAPRPETEPAPAPADADAWERRARALADEGRWRDAALALYQAVLRRLDAAGAVRYHAAKTPGDYRREARRSPDADTLAALDAFLRRFEPVAFGGRGADARVYDGLRSAAAVAGARV